MHESSQDKRIILRRPFGVEGVVVDEDRVPTSNASIRAIKIDGKDVTNFAHSDGDGRFQLDLPTNDTCRLLVRCPGKGTAALTIQPAQWGNHQTLTIVLLGTGRLTGRILDERGNPISGFPVLGLHDVGWAKHRAGPSDIARIPRALALQEDQEGLLYFRTTTDDEGRFHVSGLRPGSFLLVSEDLATRHEILGEAATGTMALNFHAKRKWVFASVRVSGVGDLNGAVASLTIKRLSGRGPTLAQASKTCDARGFPIVIAREAKVRIEVEVAGLRGEVDVDGNRVATGQEIEVQVK